MHLASRAVDALYDSLREVCPDVPSRGYVETLLRMAGLLHDVGHGPFGHFFDEHFLAELRPDARNARRDDHPRRAGRRCCAASAAIPNSRLAAGEQLDPRADRLADHAAQAGDEPTSVPRWLQLLRSLFSGIYTVDNMDFVLRDAYMSGYNTRAFDLDRLLHYSFFSRAGPDDPRPRHAGAGALHRRAGRTVPHDLLPSHRAGDRPDAGRPVRREPATTCFPAIRWSIWTSIGSSPSGRCWSTSPAGAQSDDRAQARAGRALAAVLDRDSRLEDGRASGPGVRRRATPSGAASSADAEFVERELRGSCCRRR